MIRVLVGISLVLTLASCGADGLPSKPEPRATSIELEGPVDMMGAAG